MKKLKRCLIALLLTITLLLSVSACAGKETAESTTPEKQIETIEVYTTAFEELPTDYDAAAALADGCAVVSEKTDVSALTDFAENTENNIGSAVRIAKYDGTNLESFVEIVYDGDCFTMKTRENSGISAHKYPFMFADDEGIYISDCVSAANSANFDEEIAKIAVVSAEDGDISQAVEAFKSLTKSVLASTNIVYKVYSPDGERFVSVDLDHSIIAKTGDTLKYIVSVPGEHKELSNDDSDQIASQFKRVEWLDNTRFIITFATFYDIMYFETMDTETFEVERHSYSTAYTVSGGEVSYIG